MYWATWDAAQHSLPIVVSLCDHAISKGVSVPRCQAEATYSVDVDNVYEVGDATRPPAILFGLSALPVPRHWLAIRLPDSVLRDYL